jgi:hypothetical protein
MRGEFINIGLGIYDRDGKLAEAKTTEDWDRVWAFSWGEDPEIREILKHFPKNLDELKIRRSKDAHKMSCLQFTPPRGSALPTEKLMAQMYRLLIAPPSFAEKPDKPSSKLLN